MEENRKISAFIFFCSLFSILFGLIIIYGWYTTNPIIILNISYSPVPYNTALGALLAGLGIFFARKHEDLTLLLGTLASLIGLLTLIQYAFSINLGIDELFMSFKLAPSTTPGRPAPNTAVCLFLSGLALVLYHQKIKFEFKHHISILFSLIVTGLGLISLIGYLFNLPTAYGWGHFTQMAPLTTIECCILGLGIILLHVEVEKDKDFNKRFFFPILIFLFGFIFFILLWQALAQNEQKNLKEMIKNEMSNVEDDIVSNFKNFMSGINRMTARLNYTEYYLLWEKDAKNYLADLPSLMVLAIADGNRTWKQIIIKSNLQQNKMIEDLNQCKNNIQSSNNHSTFIEPISGTLCLIKPLKNDNLQLFSVLNIEKLINLNQQFKNNFQIKLLHNNQLLFSTQRHESNLFRKWAQSSEFTIDNLKLKLFIWPNDAIIKHNKNLLPIFSLIVGILITALLAFVAYLFAVLKQRNRIEKERFHRILEATPDATIMINQNGKILFTNTQTEKLFGYLKNELIGQPIEILMPERFRQPHPSHRAQYFKSPRTRPMGIGLALFGLRKNNEEFPVEISLSPILDEEGLTAIAAVRDITERKKIEKMKNEFISVVSHELRTPLTSIQGSLDLLVEDTVDRLEPAETELLNIAKNNSERLIRLINDILDIEKIESNKIQLKKQTVELSKVVNEAYKINKSYTESFAITLKVIHENENLMIDVDCDRILQVLTNLISNAAKFSPRGSEIIMKSYQSGDYACVSVSDAGSGIPTEFQGRLFEKFSQADSTNSRKYGGTGLGLSISKAIIEMHGGKIGFITETKIGSTFYFELPLAHSFQKSVAYIGNESTNLPHILYIEDDDNLLKVVRQVLVNQANVTGVNKLFEAKEQIQKHKFDLVILDLLLPDGSGVELLPTLYKLNTPVIVFSAYELDSKYNQYVKTILVKSKTSNKELIELIKAIISKNLVRTEYV